MDVKAAHQFSSRHRRQIEDSTTCGCFYCLENFAAAAISEWVDEGQTALCPKCGIDSVIGSASGIPITPEFLNKMHQYWF
ncbi:cytoplasmic protein [Pseudomonas sp. UBA6310]|uniref:cytoplasmic protein n=1 Tax=Pseudomonas sp. UBA6310 TaxID=1947327 RepID=UPI00257A35E9|nr:cytoplasmic protein [Pseudomonas sp. UBA6310]